MNTNRSKTIALFIALTIVGVCLVVFGQGAANSLINSVLPLLGAAIFSSALTCLLVKVA
jgi:drug/metabolite transporter (DMT)-like permease